jgi:hypothetical protein
VLGHLGFKAPIVDPSSEAFLLCCDELTEDTYAPHHLYLQARVELGSAYVMYVLFGFKSAATVNGKFRCTSYRNECPVNSTKNVGAVEMGYLMDDDTLRLLVLKKWILNVYPVDDHSTRNVCAATTLWNSP